MSAVDGPRALRGGPLTHLLAVCAVFLWGTAFPAVKRGYALFLLAPDDMAGRMAFAGERFVLAGALTLVCTAVLTRRPPTIPRGRWGGAAMGGRAVPPSGAAWLLLGYLAVLSAMAFTIWTLLLKYNPVAKISIYNSLTPVFGALCSAVVLGERFFSIKNLAALALVCGGVYLVNCVPDGTGRGKTERV